MIPITVVIPCFPRDTPKLKTCLDSIENQTKKPKEVIIGHSEMTHNQSDILKKKFNYTFDLIIAPASKKCFAAENRNRACKIANCDYISFIDADDQMVSEKIEIMWQIINEYKPYCIVHNFSNNKDIIHKKFIKSDSNSYKLIFGEELYNICKKTEGEHLYLTDNIHHGHSTIKTDVLKTVKFDESFKFRRGQDSKFLRDILNKFPKDKKTMVFIDLPLSYYIPNENQ